MKKEVDNSECKGCDEIINQDNNEWVKELTNSPIFNMSLGSKELFHSNFLAWTIEQYPDEAKKFFCDILNLKEEDDCKCECECENNKIRCIEREVNKQITINKKTIKTSIDLKFKICDCTIFLENKVKSIAYKEQLDNYLTAYDDEKNCNKFILLSLKKPKFFKNNIYPPLNPTGQNQKNWVLVTYKQLINDFYKKIETNGLDSYKELLIKDYVKYVEILIRNVQPIFRSSENNKFSISKLHCSGSSKNKTLQSCENKTLKIFECIRLHDLFQKGLFEDFAYKLYEKVKKENEFQSFLPNNIVYEESSDKDTICVYSHYTNGTGLVDIRYTNSNGCSVGVQIQGNAYRQYVLNSVKTIAEKYTQCLYSKKLWFYDFVAREYYPVPDQRAKLEISKIRFKNYNGNFIYRSRSLCEIGTNDCLLKLIILDMKKAIKIQNCDCNKEREN